LVIGFQDTVENVGMVFGDTVYTFMGTGRVHVLRAGSVANIID